MHSNQQLDLTFGALADPTRRAIVSRLGEHGPDAASGMAVSDLAEPFDMSLPAVLKHLKILEEAGLVRRVKIGRTVHCSLELGPMREAVSWLERTERFWSQRLDRLAAAVEKGKSCNERKET